jgi:NAD(P)-dependent dehydrogenase (short-subunit alcohol dehydrogenase family)
MELEGRSALITGGASGFGLATARLLAAAGARLLLADLDRDGGQRAAEELGAEFVAADISDLEANRELATVAEERFGSLDLAFLNAGVSTGCGVGEDFDPALYRRAMGANLDGVIFGVHAVMPAMLRAGGGSIVATSSLAGLTAVPMDPICAANKHGVVGLVRSLGPGLEAEGIRINAVCPGFADTAIITDIKESIEASGTPIIPAEDVAGVVVGLLTGEASGECWFIQPGRSGAFEFRNIPGPRT